MAGRKEEEEEESQSVAAEEEADGRLATADQDLSKCCPSQRFAVNE
jgi:hypothetical protein